MKISPYVYPALKTAGLTYQNIINIVCEYFNIPNNLIYIKTRETKIVECRYLIWHFVKINIQITTVELGKRFRLSHCSILHGLKQIENFKTDKKFKQKFEDLSNLICNFETN